jgi:hypothetical protein
VATIESARARVILHDAMLLDLIAGCSDRVVFQHFLTLPVIKEFLAFTGEGQRFGALRRWLEDNIEDVPTPSRDDFNTQLNRIYTYVVEAGEGVYQRATPGQHSEWLIKTLP